MYCRHLHTKSTKILNEVGRAFISTLPSMARNLINECGIRNWGVLGQCTSHSFQRATKRYDLVLGTSTLLNKSQPILHSRNLI